LSKNYENELALNLNMQKEPKYRNTTEGALLAVLRHNNEDFFNMFLKILKKYDMKLSDEMGRWMESEYESSTASKPSDPRQLHEYRPR
jgi:hypothetical protein